MKFIKEGETLACRNYESTCRGNKRKNGAI